MFPSPYLYQTSLWQQFWLKTHDENHESIELHAFRGNISLRGFVYLYQWRFGQKLMHLPAGPYLDLGNNETLDSIDPDQVRSLVLEFFSKVHELGKTHQAVALRVNLDPNLATVIGIEDEDNLINFVRLSQMEANVGIPISTKTRLMFPEVAAIRTNILQAPSLGFEAEPTVMELGDFMNDNAEYWLNVSETTRKQTRRSTKGAFLINTENSEQNIRTAYALISDTAARQGFTIPTLEYFLVMSQEPFFHLLLIEDESGAPHTAWFGLHHGKVLTNQYAGNDDIALKNFLPNLAHLYGMYLAKRLECEWYDLGGYDQTSGQTRFKDGYRPEIIEFVGGVDLVYLPWYYRIIELGGKSKKIFKK